MRTIPLYRFKRADGGVTDSPKKPQGEYTERVRIIADKDKAITRDGVKLYSVKDEDTIEGWYEVNRPSKNIHGA